jgi:hypothetical protein
MFRPHSDGWRSTTIFSANNHCPPHRLVRQSALIDFQPADSKQQAEKQTLFTLLKNKSGF